MYAQCYCNYYNYVHNNSIYIQGCQQIGKAISVPASAVLGGLLTLTSFVMSPAVAKVPSTDWTEPTLIWITISMQTGSRKSTIYQYLLNIIRTVMGTKKGINNHSLCM